MPRLTASLWIAAETQRVFDICKEPPAPLLPKGRPRLLVLDDPGAVGCRYRWEYRRLGVLGKLDSVVTESRPGERLALSGQYGWEMEGDLSFVPESGGTRLLLCMRYRFPFPQRWLLPGGLIRLGVWHALHRIKGAAERTVSGVLLAHP